MGVGRGRELWEGEGEQRGVGEVEGRGRQMGKRGGGGGGHTSPLAQISMERHTVAQIPTEFVMPSILLLKTTTKKGW